MKKLLSLLLSVLFMLSVFTPAAFAAELSLPDFASRNAKAIEIMFKDSSIFPGYGIYYAENQPDLVMTIIEYGQILKNTYGFGDFKVNNASQEGQTTYYWSEYSGSANIQPVRASTCPEPCYVCITVEKSTSSDGYIATVMGADGVEFDYDGEVTLGLATPTPRPTPTPTPTPVPTSTPIPFYLVSFDANGGYGTIYPQLFYKGEFQSLIPNSFTRDGYIFTGWNTRADGSGQSIPDMDTVRTSSDATLYAQWKKKAVPTATPKPYSGLILGDDGLWLMGPGEYIFGTSGTEDGKIRPDYNGFSYDGCGYKQSSWGDDERWEKIRNYMYALEDTGYYKVTEDNVGAPCADMVLVYTGPKDIETVDSCRSGAAIFLQSQLGDAYFYVSKDITFGREMNVTTDSYSGGGSGSSYDDDDDCFYCGGDGKCNNCGGDGRVSEWTGDSYAEVRCTECSYGDCRYC